MQTLDILEKLVAFPTVSANTNLPLVDYVRSHLTDCGFECELVADTTGTKASLFATIGPKSDNGVLLSGHTDVVPVDNQDWRTDPFRLARDGDRVFGRGSTDMKGFLACMMSASSRLKGQTLKRPLHLAFSYDEEIGCVGVQPLLENLAGRGFKADFCIVGEPTSMTVMRGHKGKISARALCRGVGGHSSMAPRYLNAIHLACDFVQHLRRRQDELSEGGHRDYDYDVPYTTVHAGVIAGGAALNVVADMATVDFEIRNVAEDDADEILQRIVEDAHDVAQAARQTFSTADVTIDVLNSYPGLNIDRDDAAVTQAVGLVGNRTTGKVSFGTEAGLYSRRLAIPTVVVGPGSMAQGHIANEFIELDQLAQCDAMLDRLIGALCAP